MIASKDYQFLLPLAYKWVVDQEALILREGIPLTVDQKIDAFLIGVKNIDKVRLLKVERLPLPKNQNLKRAMKLVGLSSPRVIGVTYRYGIYIRSDYWNKRGLILHELAHTMQYERFEGIQQYLDAYISECINWGYPNGPLEAEAIKLQHEVSSR